MNTHRTDFVGYEHANRFFNINSPKVRFPDGLSYKIHDDMGRLSSLVLKLMAAQGENFFLNEYPEECSHHQFIDLDTNNQKVLDNILMALNELTTTTEIKVLRNTESGKVHLVIDVPASSMRGSLCKKAIAKWLCNNETADLVEVFSFEQWHDNVFDLKAAGIRSAFSVKVSDGRLKSKGMYVPVGTNPAALTPQEKANLISVALGAP
jgi:hypothetical protein